MELVDVDAIGTTTALLVVTDTGHVASAICSLIPGLPISAPALASILEPSENVSKSTASIDTNLNRLVIVVLGGGALWKDSTVDRVLVATRE